jgi:hypothetical protein
MRQSGPSSNAHRTLRWASSSTTGWFDRLPTEGTALAAMIAGCQAAEKRRVSYPQENDVSASFELPREALPMKYKIFLPPL